MVVALAAEGLHGGRAGLAPPIVGLCWPWHDAVMMDLLIEIPNEPGTLARVAAAISDAGVNISAATCTGPGETAQLHILVPHAEAAKHTLRISNLAVTGGREVVVVAGPRQPRRARRPHPQGR